MACPICGRVTEPRYRPFCSRRCADVDLGRWLSGSYRIPAESLEEPDEGSSDGAPGEGDGSGAAKRANPPH